MSKFKIGDAVIVNGCTDKFGGKYNGKRGTYIGTDDSNGKEKHRIKLDCEISSCKWLFTENELEKN